MRLPRHSFETSETLVPVRHGSSVQLTIDPFIQQIVEECLEQGVARSGAKAGWAVMMNPHTGAILAIGQYPPFDPDCCGEYFKDPQRQADAKLTALVDAREPGSVMKPLTSAVALIANEQLKEQGLPPIFSPEEKVATASGHFPGRSRPLQDPTFHRFLNLDMAIRKSSNIYMAHLVHRILGVLGPQWYVNQLHLLFGLGTKTGIEFPGESSGFVPKPGKLHAGERSAWSQATPFSLAIGYNLQASTLQILRAHAVFANGGYLVRPTLICREVEKRRVLPESIVRRTVLAMKYTTLSGGTAQKGDIFGYTEVGKSSTVKKLVGGQYSETLYTGSFVGFAPLKKPAFILMVSLDEPTYGFLPGYGKNHNGGSCAAVLFRAIGRRTLAYLKIPYDDPYGFPSGDPRRRGGSPDWQRECEQIQQLYDSWNR